MVEEAGGCMSELVGKGRPFELSSRAVLAANAHIHDALRDKILVEMAGASGAVAIND